MPVDFAQTAEGLLFIVDGMGNALVWDGFTGGAETAGVVAPTVGPTLADSGVGAIVGTYRAYLRFVDSRGNYSNFSPVSTDLEAEGSTGNITGATNAAPIVITTENAHGLTTGAFVKIAGVGGNTAANGTWEITVLSDTTFSLATTAGDGTYQGAGTWQSGVSTITYTAVQAATDPKIRRRQILRNTDGQALVYYVDVDTTDLTSTTFSSTNTDSILQVQESQPISDNNGINNSERDLTQAFGLPPDHRCFIEEHLGYMFMCGEVEYSEGAIAVSTGSTTVTGIGTEWTSAIAGRFIYIVGGDIPYEIASVDTVNQTLVLLTAYAGATDPYTAYAIRPPPALKKLLYYSGPGLPESWSPTDALSIQEDGDEITGLMVKSSFIFILERRHIYRMTFQSNPALDGAIYLAASRGCINNRCWCIVEGAALMLDELGVHRFDTSDTPNDSLSTTIATIFRGDARNTRINWDASRYFHCVHDPATETVRWFVSLGSDYLPRHALSYAYKLDRWAVEEYPFPIGSSCLGKLARQAQASTWGFGRDQVFLGSHSRRVLAWGGTAVLDGARYVNGVTDGTIVSATWIGCVLPYAQDTAVINSPICIVEGLGKGQVRKIIAVSSTSVTIDRPWLIKPDSTSQFQVGGIPWKYRTGWFRYAQDESQNSRNWTLMFEPTKNQRELTVRQYRDRVNTPTVMAYSRDNDGVNVTEGSPDVRVNMRDTTGIVQSRFDGSRETFTHGPELLSLGLSGFGAGEPVRVFEIVLDGVES